MKFERLKRLEMECFRVKKCCGNVFVDVEGKGAPKVLNKKIGRNIKDLPKTVSFTSGIHYAYQLV
tara:strand:- start:1058 stop:1252 length:195 start_codon:yes stop_codon:yes gene_type:complete